jgi:hypothetical protein
VILTKVGERYNVSQTQNSTQGLIKRRRQHIGVNLTLTLKALSTTETVAETKCDTNITYPYDLTHRQFRALRVRVMRCSRQRMPRSRYWIHLLSGVHAIAYSYGWLWRCSMLATSPRLLIEPHSPMCWVTGRSLNDNGCRRARIDVNAISFYSVHSII